MTTAFYKLRKLFQLFAANGSLHVCHFQIVAKVAVHIFVIVTFRQLAMLSVKAVPCVRAKITNPSVICGTQRITFRCTLVSSDYLEYRDGKATIYNWRGEERPVDGVEGDLPVLPAGEYTLTYADAARDPDARVMLTAGWIGESFR